MIHTIKNTKWIIATSLVCILLGVLTFFTFINQGFIKLNDFNLQVLLFLDISLLLLFFAVIFSEIYKVTKARKSGKLGSETSFKYLAFFSTTTLVPAILIALFSLLLFNVGLQRYFDKKIKSIVNNSNEVAQNYLEETKSSIESDILLMVFDLNNKVGIFYDNPKRFLNLLTSQRMLRKLDEVHLLDSAGNIIMSTIIDPLIDFVPPTEDAFTESLNNKLVKITDPDTNRTSALVKLNNFIDTYLYVIRFIDPKVISYIRQTESAVDFYYGVRTHKTGIKITFAIIYLLIVSLLLFISIIISINFASRLTKPIINLINASERISAGDLNTKVPKIETDKEFEKLNENFNSMIEKLDKQQKKLILAERHSAWESVARKLAHEIKNPLTPIQLSIDRIREKYLNQINKDRNNFSDYLDTINKQIHDIEHLINEFSDFARMPKPILKKVNINEVVSRSINLFKLSEPKINFTISKLKLVKYIRGDAEQLNRVFLNLIKNSIESINEKKNKILDLQGKISIDIIEDNHYIYVNIVDNGIGFKDVDKEKMLTPYFTTKKKGTGLGLAVVTKIISDHNSTILFNSNEDGATISISIPKI